MLVKFSRVVAFVLTITAIFGGQLGSPASAASSYSVSYNGNGQTSGTPPVDTLSPYNPNATAVILGNTGNLAKTGFTFSGWNTATNGTGTDYSPGSTFNVKSDLILYAKWTTNSFTVTYDGNGNSGGTPPSAVTQNFNTTFSVAGVGALIRTGYSFAGWNTAANGSGPSYSVGSTYTVTSNATLYAMWNINSYTLTFNGNGNTSGTLPASVTQNYNTTYALPSAGSFARSGYVFSGWNSAPDGSGTSYAVGSNYTITSNATLFANWSLNSYSLSYSAGTGGSLTGSTSQSVNYGGSGTAVTAVPNTGYSFVSWSDGVLTASRTDSNITANISATANFAINSYSLTYSAGNGGSLTGAASQVVNYGGSGTAVTAVPNTGYSFVSWSDGVLTASRTDSNVTANVSVTANFAINSYSLSYSAGAGGSITGPTSQTVNYGANGNAVTAVPNTGYSFVSWSDGVLTASRTGSNVTANVSVTANFAINSYSLSYSAGAGGSITGSASQSVNYGGNGTVVTAVPAVGYTFIGWSDGVLSTTRTDSNITSNLTVSANFALNSSTLTYVAGANGVISGNTFQIVGYGNNGLTVVAVPNAGYSFVGWSDGVLTASRTDSNITADISVTANFAINSYSLSYSAGAGGSITGSTSQSVNYGGDGTAVTAVPNTGYSFVSWSDGVLTASRSDLNIVSTLNVTAEFVIKTYTLNYSAGSNGSINGSLLQTITHGGNGSAVTAVPEIGYLFVSWSDGITTPTRSDANVQSDLTISALFAQENTYRVIYLDNVESELISVPADDVNYLGNSTATISSVIPNRMHYQFTGWNTASDGSGIAIAPGENRSITENLLLNAQWRVNTYTVTFNGNGSTSGSVPIDVTQNYNSTILLPGVGELSRSGYTFVNWNTAQNGSGTSYAPGSTFTLTSNSALFAIWSQIVNNENNGNNFDNNGGNNSNNNSNNSANNNGTSNLGNTTDNTPKVPTIVIEERPAEIVQVPSMVASTISPKPLSRYVFTSSTGSNVVQLNKTTTLSLSAEGGLATVVYSTMTPGICSVSAGGVVTGLHGGTCSILASITGSSKDSVTAPTVIVLIVEETRSSSLTVQPARQVKNLMTVNRNKGKFVLSLNFISAFKNKTAQLQIGLRNSKGTLKYRPIASLLLNSKGNGKVIRNATYAKSIYFRALVNKKVIVTKKFV